MLITARDRNWLDHAVAAATGNASSTILCDCEAGLDRYVGPGSDADFATPDGRPGAVSSSTSPAFARTGSRRSSARCWCRISQNVLTCPTAACFNLLDTEPFFKLGRKVAFFGDGYQFRDTRFGRPVWVIPILGGEFTHRSPLRLSRWPDGGQPVVLRARRRLRPSRPPSGAAAAAAETPGVIMPFPGGIAGQRIEGRQPLQVLDRQHLRRVSARP